MNDQGADGGDTEAFDGGDPARSGIQVIARAARILRALKQDSSGMTLGQVAEAVDLPRSTVQRIANALKRERFIVSGSAGGGLRLGPELGALAEAARQNIVESCREQLSELSRTTGETADLAVFRGATMVFLDQVPGSHRLRTVSAVGDVFPLTTTANGRACLAKLPVSQAELLAQEEWARFGIDGDLGTLRATLDKTRDTGLAYDLDEHTAGISAIGFAFADWAGELYSISVPVPSTRFRDNRAGIEAALREAKASVESQLTWD
ncbi:MAG: IclR family transcriptional regulator [Pseudomonadota bacterium]